jgi:hypothetical protein
MKRLRLTKARQAGFLKTLAGTGNVTAAAAFAGTSRTRVYELRKMDSAFAAAWDEAEEMAADALEAEARRRASRACRNRWSALARLFAMMKASRLQSDAIQIICFWRCSKRAGHRDAKDRYVSNCQRCGRPMQPALWQPSLPGLPRAT